MARFCDLEVRLERQPHRDAVQRLRQAYRRLWQAFRLSEETDELKTEAAPRSPNTVQEVT